MRNLRSILVASALFVASVAAVATPKPAYAVKETHFVPRKWKRVGPAVSIVMTHRDGPVFYLVRLHIRFLIFAPFLGAI